MRITTLTIAVIALARVASAGDAFDGHVGDVTNADAQLRADWPAPRFALCGDAVYDGAKQLQELTELPTWRTDARGVTALAGDKQAAWVAADLVEAEVGCGMSKCPPRKAGPATHHAVMLWQHARDGWSYIALDIAPVVDAKAQSAAAHQRVVPSPIARRIDAGAEDAAKLFEATLADPKAFAATVSDRPDVVLYGSERAERTVGGAKVRAKLAGWQLGLKVRDGVQAGTTASRTVAWVAANVDATPLKKSGAPALPYRLFALYEKAGASWRAVHISFSVVETGPTAAAPVEDAETACENACTDYAGCYERVYKGKDFHGGGQCVNACVAKTPAERATFVKQTAAARTDAQCKKLME